MRWVTFRLDERAEDHVGVLAQDGVVEVRETNSLLDLLEAGPDAMRTIGERALTSGHAVHVLDNVELQAPIPRPTTIRDFMAFEQHVVAAYAQRGDNVPPDWYELPVFYFSNPHAVVGPYAEVPRPPGSKVFDFEVEVAAVVGVAGYNLTTRAAEECIAGYLIMNDWSARDLQTREMALGLGPAKGKDTATTLGPMLVTPDELAPRCREGRYDLEMIVSVNGNEYGRDTLSHMYWTFGELIAYASRGTWVRPGDVIGSGTFGNGCLWELKFARQLEEYPWLAAGDRVDIEVAGLGRVSNLVVAGAESIPLRAH